MIIILHEVTMQVFLCFCVITVLVSPGFVNTWDLAVTVEGQIEFFNKNGTRSNTVGFADEQFSELTTLAYDGVYQTLYFADSEHSNATIFGFHVSENKEVEHLVSKTGQDDILGIAFDPVSGRLFWTDGINNTIFWASFTHGSGTDGRGSVLIKMEDEVPKGITVDSCRGHIYWTNSNSNKPSIERATIEGMNREIIINEDLFKPVSITIDQGSQKLYWADDREGIYYQLESSNLDGSGREIIYKGSYHQPNNLAITKDSIYWTDWIYKSVWQLPLNRTSDSKPTVFKTYVGNSPMGIVSRVNISEQIEGFPECKRLKETILSSVRAPLSVATPYCLNGGTMRHNKDDALKGNRICNCPREFSGYRCETAICHNYCFYGTCSLNSEGLPVCSCPEGYQGNRCHEVIRKNYCLNGGTVVSKDNREACECPAGWKGNKCEMKDANYTKLKCSCSDHDSKMEKLFEDIIDDGNFNNDKRNSSSSEMSGAESELDQYGINLIMWILLSSLIILCFAQSIAIYNLRRRPRIKKRIIVNKNVTPLTCRPEPPQCEIIIENCCNMNICETPCFEPEGLREQLRDAGKKEEKKNLLINIERPDDMY